MPVRRHEPIFVPSRASTYATRHDYGIEDSLNRADYLSNAVLQDTYDAASRSRGKDHELLRNLNAAIRSPPVRRSQDISPSRRAGRPESKLPPGHINSKLAVLPYRNLDKIRSALSSSASSSPATSSLLSSRINSYLRGAPKPDNISPFTRFIPSPRLHTDIISDISYKPFLSDTSSSSSPSILSNQLAYPSLSSAYRSASPPSYPSLKLATYDRDYLGGGDDDDDDYEPETSYKRKYKIIRSPLGSGEALTNPRLAPTFSSQASDTDYDENDDDDDTYSCPRPSGTPSVKLSSYDGDYDGSYEADMAEMYDYVPFGPSRQGILELSQHDNYVSPSLSSPSYMTSAPLSIRSLAAPVLSSNLSVVPQHSSYLDDAAAAITTTRPYQPNTLLDSLVSDTVIRAKKVLANSKLPDYKQASLLLSVEGSAVSEDGKNRYGFRYYPPPIPLKGSHIGLDQRILGIAPKCVSSPADSFLSNYLNRLRDIRSDVRDQADKRDYGRIGSVAPTTYISSSQRLPAYTHSTLHLPVHIEGRAHSVPVSSYRSRLHDGQSHRVDVFPLVVSETTLPSDKNLHLPYYKASPGPASADRSPNKLTVLEKINIKAAIIGSRMEAADGGRRFTRPRSDYAANKLRELKREEVERRYN